jgi:GNAT superfamily N-acetyltransferase
MTIRAFGGAAFARDTAFCSDDYAGAALWLRPGVHADEKRLGELMESTGSPDGREARSAIFEQMAQYHPKEAHWYLPLIGVDPSRQHRGHGDALMRYALEQVDRENAAAYLESSNPRNISFYRSHGFVEIGAIQAGSSPVLFRCCDVRDSASPSNPVQPWRKSMQKAVRATLTALVVSAAVSVGAQAGEYGNKCAMGMAAGQEVQTDCSIKSEIDGKTYCFGDEDAKMSFIEDSAGNIEKADAFELKVGAVGEPGDQSP